jgi:hypothetical protein
VNIIVIDNEGIGALDEDQTHDTKIFTLASLLPSWPPAASSTILLAPSMRLPFKISVSWSTSPSTFSSRLHRLTKKARILMRLPPTSQLSTGWFAISRSSSKTPKETPLALKNTSNVPAKNNVIVPLRNVSKSTGMLSKMV